MDKRHQSTTLQEPWKSMATRLGGAYKLYDLIQLRVGVSLSTAKRLCRKQATMTEDQWYQVNSVLAENGELYEKRA